MPSSLAGRACKKPPGGSVFPGQAGVVTGNGKNHSAHSEAGSRGYSVGMDAPWFSMLRGRSDQPSQEPAFSRKRVRAAALARVPARDARERRLRRRARGVQVARLAKDQAPLAAHREQRGEHGLAGRKPLTGTWPAKRSMTRRRPGRSGSPSDWLRREFRAERRDFQPLPVASRDRNAYAFA